MLQLNQIFKDVLNESSGAMMQNVEFENRVKLARVEKGMTQEELADFVGVSRQTIGLIEAGKYNPTLKLCLAIAKVTEKKLDALFWIKGETK